MDMKFIPEYKSGKGKNEANGHSQSDSEKNGHKNKKVKYLTKSSLKSLGLRVWDPPPSWPHGAQGCARARNPNPPNMIPILHQIGRHERSWGIRTEVLRRISARIFLEGSQPLNLNFFKQSNVIIHFLIQESKVIHLKMVYHFLAAKA